MAEIRLPRAPRRRPKSQILHEKAGKEVKHEHSDR
jgi:hypothetical protein